VDGEALAGHKKTPAAKSLILFQDESGVSERPPVRRTWLRREKLGVGLCLQLEKLSISAALGYRWDGKRSRLWFQTQSGSYNDQRLIAFVRDLKKHLRGKRRF